MSLANSFGPIDYSDGRTKQSFKDSTDINKILRKAQREGTLSHLAAHGGEYGDFSNVPDLLEAHALIQRGETIFQRLPSELRNEFANDQFKFFEFVNKPENKDRLDEVLPMLAEPGFQNPPPRRSARTEANPATLSAEPETAAPTVAGTNEPVPAPETAATSEPESS